MNKSTIVKIENVWLITALSLFLACGDSNSGENTKKTAEKQANSVVFAVENYYFAIKENDKYRQYNKAIYHRGDEIYLLLNNVGTFARGKDSLNNADMIMTVKDAVGQVITTRKNLFGQNGHADFENNILNKPYASYESDVNDKPGKYSMTVIIYDLVKNDSIVIEDDFFIE